MSFFPFTEDEWFLFKRGLEVVRDGNGVRFNHKSHGVVYECDVAEIPGDWRDNVLGALDLLRTFPP